MNFIYIKFSLIITFKLTKFLLKKNRVFINYTKDKNSPISLGIFYSFVLFIASVSGTIFLQQNVDRMVNLGAIVTTSLMNLIYKKVNILYISL